MTNVTRSMWEHVSTFSIGAPDDGGVRFDRQVEVTLYSPIETPNAEKALEEAKKLCLENEIAVLRETVSRPCLMGMTINDFCANAHVLKYKD